MVKNAKGNVKGYDSGKEEDEIVVQTREGRRTILRDGAALILAGTASSFAGTVLGDDCDRQALEGEQKEAGNGSDSDAGEGSDRQGCGSPAQISSLINENTASVVKIKG